MLKIDLNSDLGESYGRYHIGKDDQVIPLITSANIACGYHAGDPDVIAKTVATAEENHVGVGAHPGFPDLDGFGRRKMDMSLDSVSHMVTYQIAALAGFTSNHKLHHVKPHGALYNAAGKDLNLALAICRGIKEFDPNLTVYALSNGKLVEAAKQLGLPVAQEVFADRNYEADGSLVSRKKPNAVLTDPEVVAKRTVEMIKNQAVTAITGETVPLTVNSICVHGDNDAALQIVSQLHKTLNNEQIDVATY
ncbi:lactam utilization protein LamB [Lentilactobacillus curieae]|uniref:5-oxoprolinase subunit A n=1 Tax=Lentilactobacillus curieae TaxID=1138822 RepID=A0A1S6QH56_9LACO|nr:5-oxoprolinase subunit PxpA [Lentilactobacillus curieae]AQW20930.1 lactam utilization protein LamB [Lentilactobacillus curieae]